MANGMWARINRSQKVWGKIKKDPIKLAKYNKRSSENSKKYRLKHRGILSERMAELREIARERGDCPNCLHERDNPKYKLCSKCRAYYLIRSSLKRKK